ncbi:MAG: ankyrin repeat domain-containing protein [Planctomycetota bacterium]
MTQSERPSVPAPTGAMSLPARPELEHLKNQAKRRLDALRRSDPKAKLSTAQFALARDYGFSSWRKLKAHVDRLQDRIDDLLAAVKAGDVGRITSELSAEPALANAAVENRRLRVLPTDTRAMRLLHVAVGARQEPAIQTLLRLGADPNLRNADGRMPMHDAFELGLWREPVSSWFMEHGGRYDAALAAGVGAIDPLRGLLGGDSALANDLTTNLVPLAWAACGWQVEAAQLLLDYGARYTDPPARDHVLWALAATESHAVLRVLLDHGLDPNARYENGDTLLHRVLRSKLTTSGVEFAQALLEHGFDANAVDGKRLTPLAVAVAMNGGDVRGHADDALIGQKHFDELIDLLRQHTEDADSIIEASQSSSADDPASSASGFGRLAMVAFPVADLVRSRAFYEGVLGAEVLSSGDNAIDLKLGDVRIRAYVQLGEYRRQHSGLGFLVEDIDAKVETWRAQGVAFNGGLREEPWGGRVVTIRDPDGNLFDAVDASYGDRLDVQAGPTQQTVDALEQALEADDADAMRGLLDRFPSLIDHIGGQWTQPLLHRAAYAGHAGVVDLLLERGFDVNKRDKNDNAYALHFAAEQGLDIAKRLVEAGGDIHGDGDEHELGVLGWATCFGKVNQELADYLMERGAKPHLFSAIAMGMADTVRGMLKADPSLVSKTMSKHEHHRTALMHAAKCGRPEMVALLLEFGADASAVDGAGQTAMTFAADEEVIALLKNAGAELDLLGALNSGAFEVAERLLEDDPGRLGPEGADSKALHLAVAGDKPEAVRWLIGHGVDLDARRELWGCLHTALHVSVEHNRPAIAKLLLEAGADPSVQDSVYDATALGWAEHFRRDEFVELIKSYGGRPAVAVSDELRERWRQALSKDTTVARVVSLIEEHPELMEVHPWPGSEMTALEAMAYRCVWHRPAAHEIVKYLIAHGARHRFQTAARAGVLERVEAMLADDPSLLNQRDDKGRTALYRASCVYGDFPMGTRVATLLLDEGAEVDLYSACALGMVDRVEALIRADASVVKRVDPDGCTALHWSVRPRERWMESRGLPRDAYLRISRLLLEAGAAVDTPNRQEDGMQALHHVGEWAGDERQARLLIEHGADINAAAEQNGWTPLDYAEDRGRDGIAAVLRSLGGEVSGKR